MISQRETWIDYVKVFACILVASGHFLMGLLEAGLLTDTIIYNWFIRTIYYFHVPLFFLCSGYLYQKKANITTYSSWKSHVFRKAVALGIPYFVFSMITWILKSVFSGSVNTQNNGLLVTMLVKPASPYWYLYTLFFVFLITPTFSGEKSALLGLLTAIVLKYVRTANFFTTDIYAVTQTADNLIWFVSGMCLHVFRIPERCRKKTWKSIGLLCGVLFLAASCSVFEYHFDSASVNLIMGMMGCMAVFLIVLHWTPGNKMRHYMDTLSQYTLPVYLMHTIFAAGIRAVLIKLGIESTAVHVIFGLTASFIGPIIAVWIMERLKLDILIYPGKYRKC